MVAFLCFADFNDLPDIQKTILGFPADKVVHFCMFFPLPIIGYMAFGVEQDTRFRTLLAIINICAFSCIFAGVTELVQGSLPYRSEDINDFAVDCLSIGISGLLVFIFALFDSGESPLHQYCRRDPDALVLHGLTAVGLEEAARPAGAAKADAPKNYK